MKFFTFLLFFKVALIADTSISKEFYTFEMNNLLEQKYISLDSDLYKDYIANDININDALTQPQKDILEDTLYVQVAMISAIGVLLLMPESVTNWDSGTFSERSLDSQWKENVQAGPVLDEDSFTINYLGHPVSGAVYYTMARNDGLDPFESFVFSTLMSSFFWEYGYEAFAEIPSIQDLVSTPVIGAFMGEYMHYLEKELDKNRGLVFDSRYLGNVSYFFLDPIGRITNGISNFLDLSVTMKFNTYQDFAYKKHNEYNIAINKPAQFSSFNYGVELNFQF